jgi:hypothetical protein
MESKSFIKGKQREIKERSVFFRSTVNINEFGCGREDIFGEGKDDLVIEHKYGPL